MKRSFSVDFNPMGNNDILDIHKFLIKKYNIKKCLKLIKKCLLHY